MDIKMEMPDNEAVQDEVNTQKQKKEIDNLDQGFVTRLARKFSLKSTFAAVAGVAVLTAAAIAAPALVSLTSAFAAAAGIMMVGTGIVWAISQDNDYRKLSRDKESEWHNYYRNGKLTQRLGKLSISGVFASTAIYAGAVATAIAATPLAPYVTAAATISLIMTAGTGIVYGFRRTGGPAGGRGR